MEKIITKEEMAALNAYAQLPDKLKLHLGQNFDNKKDIFGVRDRLKAIKFVLQGRFLGKIADLGGHSGFFSLSLVDSGMASYSSVYDLNRQALAVGEKISIVLGLTERISFIEKAINLDFLLSMPSVDTVVCLNLIHHAGAIFDVDVVKSMGWEEYSKQCLSALRRKAGILIMGVGFKHGKPPYWDISAAERPARFFAIAEKAGWSIMYDANVLDIRKYGVSEANALRTKGMSSKMRFEYFLKFLCFGSFNSSDKTGKYHLYVMEAF